MPRITFRLAVALLTFMLGLTGVWLANLGSQLSDAIFEQLMPRPTLDAPPAGEQFIDDDAYAVYSKVIEEMFVRDGVKLVVIEQQTNNYAPIVASDAQAAGCRAVFVQSMRADMQGTQTEALTDYCARRPSGLLTWRFNLDVPYVLVDSIELDTLSGPQGLNDFWPNFNRHYPASTGIIGLSNIGFNRAHTQAFVYVSRSCAGLCGEGNYVLLEKHGNTWEIIKKEVAWVS